MLDAASFVPMIPMFVFDHLLLDTKEADPFSYAFTVSYVIPERITHFELFFILTLNKSKYQYFVKNYNQIITITTGVSLW